MPARIEPCLAVLANKPPIGPDWAFEVKWDGYRVAVHIEPNRVRILTRNGHDWTDRFPAIEAAARALGVTAVLDGEAVVLDEEGRSDFNALLKSLGGRGGKRPAREVMLYAFDLLYLDGHDLREYDVQELRREIGIIFQDFVRYQLTAADNIAVGRIEEREDRARIVRTAQRSLADTVIAALPRQYGQMVGRRFATGVELSGGEWQKLALARAYMREAQVMILDEPTAALDARAEHEVFQRFTELTRGKTAVLISHRFSTVRMADRIVVLERGALCEVGTHEELVQQNGRYADLFQLQARGYR